MKNPSIRLNWTIAITLAALVTSAAPAAFAGDAAAGKTTYTINCLACHGETGKGDGPVGQVLQPPPRDFSGGKFQLDTDGDGKTGTDADLKAVIAKGAAAYGGNQMMTAWGGVLSDEDIENLVAYIHTLKD